MNSELTLTNRLAKPESRTILRKLYGERDEVLTQKIARIERLGAQFEQYFGYANDLRLFSTPGRTEVGGNHTDHNHGRVLAAAVDRDVIALAEPTQDFRIEIFSEGYPAVQLDSREKDADPEERFSSTALVRGIVARLSQLGYQTGGFKACITSDVPKGSGLSSSAAYEVMIATILNHLYNEGRIDAVTIAQSAQFAENQYFGKPCGLMDQISCTVGGFVTIDFKDNNQPKVSKVAYDFADSGYVLAIVETGGDHADLNEEYASVAGEMRAIARALGGEVLRDVREDQVFANIRLLREAVNDRAILRALHFFRDNARVEEQVRALKAHAFEHFLKLVQESGDSSWKMNQNCYSNRTPTEQGIPLGIVLTEEFLKGQGACRVHGGGFAGTIQAFIPKERIDAYLREMKGIFGEDSCYAISIRNEGSILVQI